MDEAFKTQVEKQQVGVSELRKTFVEEMEKMESLKQKQLLELEKTYSNALREAQQRMAQSREAEAAAVMRAERVEKEAELARVEMARQAEEMIAINKELTDGLALRSHALSNKHKEIESITAQMQGDTARWEKRIEEREKGIRQSDLKIADLEQQVSPPPYSSPFSSTPRSHPPLSLISPPVPFDHVP